MLSVLYHLGEGVEQSYLKSFYWCSKAANQGNKEAQTMLGTLYYEGRGVEKSETQAIYWLRKACENFEDKACKILNEIKNKY